MKVAWKRSVSVFLILAMAVTLCLTTGNEAWATEVEDTVTEETEGTGGETLNEFESEDADSSVTDVDIQGDSGSEYLQDTGESVDGTDLGTDTGEIVTLDEGLPEEDESSDETPVTSDTEPGENQTFDVSMKYDDYKPLSEVLGEEIDLSEYVEQEPVQEIKSYQVNQGSVGELDENVAEIEKDKDGNDRLHATGVGKATLTWTKTQDTTSPTATLPLEDTENMSENDSEGTSNDDTEDLSSDIAVISDEATGDTITLIVEVEPAPLTVMYIAGQSNAEGVYTGGSYSDSILCEEGQVYSTYAPSNGHAYDNTGLSMRDCNESNASSFVAEALTSDISLNGTNLTYKLNALTEAGDGKTGMDSGLAYEWNQLTQDKVWVVNAGWSATSIDKWTPGNTGYDRALAVFQNANTTLTAEVSAQHYTLKHTFLFWLQGESDQTMSASDYMSYYNQMYQGFASADLGIDQHGIIETRANTGTQTTSADLKMTGPRVAQYLMGNSSSDTGIYVVSNANEQWVTDSGVANYFAGRMNYTTHNGTPSQPTTVAEVHSDVHYSQIAHNANGISAADGMYQVVHGGASPSSIFWYDEDGSIQSAGTELQVAKNESTILVPVADPVYAGKGMSVSVSSSALSYDSTNGTITANGSGTITATAGGISSSLTVSGEDILATPTLKSAEAVAGGIKITWNSVSGATGYRVFRKVSGGSWSNIGFSDGTATNYTDSTVDLGTTYIYTVRAYRGTQDKAIANAYSETYWSSYDGAGVSAKASQSVLSTPKLVSATAKNDSITVTWNSVSGAGGYRVFRKPSGGSWSNIGLTTSSSATSYTDSDVDVGTTYYYTVRAYKGDQSTALANCYKASYWSDYDGTGVSAKAGSALSTPTLVSATASNGSITVKWNSVSGASGYRVFRKPSGGSWSNINVTTSTSYTDSTAESGVTYYYTVRAYKGDQSKALANCYKSTYWSSYDSTGVSAKATSALSTPSLKSATTTSGSIKVTWNSVSGASGYRVFRKTSGGSWGNIGVTTSTSYTDSTAKLGTTYYYTVRAYKGSQSTALANCYAAAYWSGYNGTGVSTKVTSVLDTPSLQSASNSSGSIKVTWNSVSGASGYRVFRKTSGGSWSNIGFSTGTSTNYTDSTVNAGTTYYYTVRAFKGDQSTATKHCYDGEYWSGYNGTGVSFKAVAALSTPTLKSASASNGNITVTWNSVSGASGYRVFRKPSGGSWSNIGLTNSSSATSYTDSTVDIGTTYYYTVRAYKGDQSTALANAYHGAYWSEYDTKGVSAKGTSALSTPSLTSATASAGSITVKWNSVSGASGYRVFRKKSGGSWSNIGLTTSTSYTDSTNIDVGTTYYYTVRAYKGDQSTALANTYHGAYWSGYDSSGVSAKGKSDLGTPTLSSASSSSGKITVNWSSVSGASGYAVYRKVSGGSWSMLDTTTSTSYTDSSNFSVGTAYYYTVRAFKGSESDAMANRYNASYWSDYNSSGVSAKATSTISTPSLTTASSSSGTITVQWNSVSGASGYAVYRKTSSSGWSMIDTTSNTKYIDSYNFSVGTTYYYTVRAYKGTKSTAMNNKYTVNYWSDYNSSGVSASAVSTLSTPSLISADKTSSGVTVKWNSVSGASGYRVFRKKSGGSWSNIGLTTSTSYTDTSSLSSGTTYYYTVRAYKGSQSTALNNCYTVNYWSGYDGTGVKCQTVENEAMYNKAQSYSSSTKWMILCDCSINRVGIFYGSQGNWEMKYYWECSTGANGMPTKKGTFTILSKGKSFSGPDYTCWYYSQFYGNYLFHSVLYELGSSTQIKDGRLGMDLSHGCVRLAKDNAKWIYDNVPIGSRVVTYS